MKWLDGITDSKDWSFSISPSNEYSGVISFRMNWLDLLAVQGHMVVELSRYSVVNVTTLMELNEVFKYVLVTRIKDRLCIIPYMDI